MSQFSYELYAAEKSCSIVFDALDATPTIVKANGEKANILDVVGYMFVASFYSIKRFFSPLDHKSLRDEKLFVDELAFYLSYLTLNVEVDESGEHVVAVKAKEDWDFEQFRRLNHGACPPKEGKPTEPVAIEVREGNTIYQIQNLNIYLTADFIQQLNMNPKEVINHNDEQIRAIVLETVKQYLKDKM